MGRRNSTMNVSRMEACQFASSLAVMHAEANRIGLLKTGHALHEAVRAAGWEIAENLEIQDRKSAQEPSHE